MPKPIRDRFYLAWVRSLPCAICNTTRSIEAAHTGSHGMAQKSSDRSAIPLCIPHHRTGPTSFHKLGQRKFEERHNLDIQALVERLNAKPYIKIEGGRYVGYLEGKQYQLGFLESGLSRAVVAAKQLYWQDREGS